jgi:hypothetical protein
MSIFLWLLTLAGYVGFLVYTSSVSSDLSLIAGIVATIVGLISFVFSKKNILLVSYGILFLGIVVLYPVIVRTGLVYIWLGAIILMLFFASLSMRGD